MQAHKTPQQETEYYHLGKGRLNECTDPFHHCRGNGERYYRAVLEHAVSQCHGELLLRDKEQNKGWGEEHFICIDTIVTL